MKVSIITVVKNNVSTIKHAIESVLGQTYNNIEYIVIDGGSTDGTYDIVEKYNNKIKKFISEMDNGLYDAMNKGLNHASGDIVGILNSDDVYFNKHVIEDVVKTFKEKKLDSLFGDLFYVEKNNIDKVVRYWKSSEFKLGSFAKGWHPQHPSFFVKNEIYKKYGVFDTSMEVSADFDLMLRFLERHKISTAYLPKVLVKMRIGGESNKSIRNIITSNRSILRAFDKNRIKVNKLAYIFYRLVPKIFQMIKK